MVKIKVFICGLFLSLGTVMNSQTVDSLITDNSLNDFLDGIGKKESGNRYNVTSKSGYLGKYQFHPKTLKTVGINVNKSNFLKSKTIQDNAMIKLLKLNKEKLRSEIEKHVGRMVKGKLITESGILAAAHLSGYEKVKKYLTSGIDFKDGNGVKISHYISKFSGFKLNLETY